MSQPFKLFRLQQVDSQIDQALTRLDEIERVLRDEAALQATAQTAQRAGARLDASKKDLRRAEDIARAQRTKIEQTEASLYGGSVRNPKELQDLQNESAALKRYLAVLEDRQLEAMIAMEEAEEEAQAAHTALEEAKAHAHMKHARLTSEQGRLKDEVARLRSEREAAASSIEAEELDLYQRLRQKRAGLAVAKVADRACSACGTSLNSALLQAARSPSQVSYCETCGRILYAG